MGFDLLEMALAAGWRLVGRASMDVAAGGTLIDDLRECAASAVDLRRLASGTTTCAEDLRCAREGVETNGTVGLADFLSCCAC